MDIVSILLDLITILLLITPVGVGIKKGFKNRVLTIISFIVSAAAATAISTAAAPKIYDKYFHDSILTECQKAVDNYNPVYKVDDLLKDYGIDVEDEKIQEALTSADNLSESVGDLAEDCGLDSESLSELKGEISDTLETQVSDQLNDVLPGGLSTLSNTDYSAGQIYDTIRACAASTDEGAEYIENRYAAPIVTAVLKIIIFAIVLPIAGLVMLLVFYIFGFSFKDGSQTASDKVLGGILGLVSGAVNVVAYVVIISFCEQTTQGLFDVTQTNSMIFKAVYELLY